MNLKHLEFFVELAKTQHMAKAAKNLGISQPSLSYAIKSLEDELKIPLFEKDGRNIKLTNYGKIYLEYVKSGLAEFKSGADSISQLLDENSGQINLGFTFTMGQDLVPHLVSKFQEEKNNDKVQFSFHQGVTNNLVQDLLDDKLDIVFASQPTFQGANDQINCYHLVDQRMLAAVAYSNPLSKRESVTLKELTEYPFIYYSQKSGLRSIIDTMFSHAKIEPRIVFEADEDHTIIGFVHWGYGVAIIPHLPQLNPYEVKMLPISDNVNVHPIYLFTKANHFLTPVVNRFKQFSLDYCEENFTKKNKLI